MLFWGRKEVYMGKLSGFTKSSSILAQNKIKYEYRVINRNSAQLRLTRSTIGGIGESIENNIYYLYVHKNDYDNALFLLHS